VNTRREAQIRLAFYGLLRKPPIKPVYTTARVEHALLTSVKRMAIRADINLHIPRCRAGCKRIAAAAANGGSDVLGMSGLFHHVLGWAALGAAGGKGRAKVRFS